MLLPHDIIPAAHCLAPLDDIHLAHLINELKPPAPSWSISSGDDEDDNTLIESNDRLRTDELADLPAPEAERLHATYDIEDHLDCTPDRLLVSGPSTPLAELLKQVKETLIKNATLHPHNNTSSSASYEQTNHVYVARIWFQPIPPIGRLFKWAKGGADLIRFELACNHTQSHPIIIHWSTVEVALSQALEVSHQLLALLHSRQFNEILESIDLGDGTEFRAINPIVWLVDPVEYAHAQLRESTEWGWSEHHVELKSSSTTDRRNCISCPVFPGDSNNPSLSKELGPEDTLSFSSASLPGSQSQHNLSDDLPSWLDDLLDRRLPRLLSLPDGCLSYELLNHHRPRPQPSIVPFTLATSPPSHDNELKHTSLEVPSIVDNHNNLRPNSSTIITAFSAIGSPNRPFGFDQQSIANSVPSFDQHYIPSPGINPNSSSLRHGQTNTLRYYNCKACAEHAFKLALSFKLNQESKRRTPYHSIPMTHHHQSSRTSSSHLIPLHLSHHKRSGSNGSYKNGSSMGTGLGDRLVIESDDQHPSSFTSVCCSNLVQLTTPIDTHDQPKNLANGDQDQHSIPNHDYHHHHHQDCELKYSNMTAKSVGKDPVIGLGVKGKAVKEAMDREHDQFIKHHHHHHQSLLNSTTTTTKGISNNSACNPVPDGDSSSTLTHHQVDRHHTWDEGEAVDD
ncbi:hypothetical protein MJO28_005156 [Puccinia striiformis f. sp. tritici]|uniref:Uncharacterized protein n=1 Tax=Puccinia striiformis f. sp. tritici TaxID=168172 RepID=A0ACC0ELG4_9BASI|nr:hypothetical protein Pst134EA_009321 [Puccinia striiformis f. sp. tritici]KAH9468791.1 hypothetical protein Pst134EA_009321 [Puccinia striiformis f. sp. tritici]KAI7954756.1 hypothetical protein MJO28_005156 [Puccinia striiformis f. sp. tritici]